MKFPALPIAVCFAAGILGRRNFSLPHLPHAFAVTLAASLAFSAARLRASALRHANACLGRFPACLVLARAPRRCSSSAWRFPRIRSRAWSRGNRLELTEPLRWRGRLRADPLRLPWGMRYDIDLDKSQSAGNWIAVSRRAARGLLLRRTRARDVPPPLRAGDRVEVLLRARLVRNFGDPGAFDYRAFLARPGYLPHGTLRNADADRQDCPARRRPSRNAGARLRGRLLGETRRDARRLAEAARPWPAPCCWAIAASSIREQIEPFQRDRRLPRSGAGRPARRHAGGGAALGRPQAAPAAGRENAAHCSRLWAPTSPSSKTARRSCAPR